jgi:hypothetical protein
MAVRWQLGDRAVPGASLAGLKAGVTEESEDPWLCDPGFRRVCPCLGLKRAR